MEDQEKDEILYRLDERTERIENELTRRVEKLEQNVGENRGRINAVENDTLKNSEDISKGKAVLGALVAGFTTVLAKVGGALRLI